MRLTVIVCGCFALACSGEEPNGRQGADSGAAPNAGTGGRAVDATGGAPASGGRSSMVGGASGEAGGARGGAGGAANAPDGSTGDGRDASTYLPDAGTMPDSGGADLSRVLPRSVFDSFFLHEDDPACAGGAFTHAALIEAARMFPSFGGEGDLETRQREVAAFLANVSHETTGGWPTAPDGPEAWGLCFVEEVGCGAGGCTGYCQASAEYPCATGRTYHGRGPMQLSWNYNYGQAGEAIGLDLLGDPDRVTRDPVIGWKTALWFWMTPQPPKPSAHDVMIGAWSPAASDLAAGRVPGFGMTINIINGGLECNRPTDGRVQDRVAFYERYASLLGVSPGSNLYCDTMQSY